MIAPLYRHNHRIRYIVTGLHRNGLPDPVTVSPLHRVILSGLGAARGQGTQLGPHRRDCMLGLLTAPGLSRPSPGGFAVGARRRWRAWEASADLSIFRILDSPRGHPILDCVAVAIQNLKSKISLAPPRGGEPPPRQLRRVPQPMRSIASSVGRTCLSRPVDSHLSAQYTIASLPIAESRNRVIRSIRSRNPLTAIRLLHLDVMRAALIPAGRCDLYELGVLPQLRDRGGTGVA